MHPTRLTIERLSQQCDIRRQRRSGPGGQHRNKVETGIFLTHRPTGIEAAATERRSQAANQAVALERLRLKLAIEFRSRDSPTVTFPSDLWQSRSRGGRIVVSREHVDFASLLAECLDVIVALDLDFVAAAKFFACSRSQLFKLICRERAALDYLNRQRAARGLKPLSPALPLKIPSYFTVPREVWRF